MEQKVLKIGTSAGITLSKEALAALGIAIGDRVRIAISSTDHTVSIAPVAPVTIQPGDDEVIAWTKDFMKRYHVTLTELKDL